MIKSEMFKIVKELEFDNKKTIFKNINSANAIMKGFEVYYNFIMKHQAINKCPYELATDLKLNNPNKWVELIHISKRQ